MPAAAGRLGGGVGVGVGVGAGVGDGVLLEDALRVGLVEVWAVGWLQAASSMTSAIPRSRRLSAAPES